MHPRFDEAHQLTSLVIHGAIQVHRHFGPGLLESIYEWALAIELAKYGLQCTQQRPVVLTYKGHSKEETLKCDLLVNDCLLLEIKAIDGILPQHKAQVLSYMHLLDVPLGLVLNFNSPLLRNGISRLILPDKPVLL